MAEFMGDGPAAGVGRGLVGAGGEIDVVAVGERRGLHRPGHGSGLGIGVHPDIGGVDLQLGGHRPGNRIRQGAPTAAAPAKCPHHGIVHRRTAHRVIACAVAAPQTPEPLIIGTHHPWNRHESRGRQAAFWFRHPRHGNPTGTIVGVRFPFLRHGLFRHSPTSMSIHRATITRPPTTIRWATRLVVTKCQDRPESATQPAPHSPGVLSTGWASQRRALSEPPVMLGRPRIAAALDV